WNNSQYDSEHDRQQCLHGVIEKDRSGKLEAWNPGKELNERSNGILKIVGEGWKPGDDYQADDKPGAKDSQARPQIRIEPHSVGAPFLVSHDSHFAERLPCRN